jgi:predicted DNA-binding ribbon-helix-helix protein
MLSHDAKMRAVRTTVRLDDDLYREVKARAAREGRTVASVLEDAVRVGMRRPAEADTTPFVNVPVGRGGLMPGVDLSNNAALSDLLDADTPLEQLR